MIRRHLLPTLAALTLVFLFVWSGWTALAADEASAAELTGPAQTWAKSIEMHAPGPAGPTITVVKGECPTVVNAGGCWAPWMNTIWAFSRESYAHELGHAFDTRNLDAGERAWFLAVFGYPSDQPWEPARGADTFCDHIQCPNERFADTYAGCALGYQPVIDDGFRAIKARGSKVGYLWWSGMIWTATNSEFKRACKLIARSSSPAAATPSSPG